MDYRKINAKKIISKVRGKVRSVIQSALDQPTVNAEKQAKKYVPKLKK